MNFRFSGGCIPKSSTSLYDLEVYQRLLELYHHFSGAAVWT